jgi:hypothetical protein
MSHHCPECGADCNCCPDEWIEEGEDFCTHDCATEPDECRPTGGRGPQPGDRPGIGVEYREPER